MQKHSANNSDTKLDRLPTGLWLAQILCRAFHEQETVFFSGTCWDSWCLRGSEGLAGLWPATAQLAATKIYVQASSEKETWVSFGSDLKTESGCGSRRGFRKVAIWKMTPIHWVHFHRNLEKEFVFPKELELDWNLYILPIFLPTTWMVLRSICTIISRDISPNNLPEHHAFFVIMETHFCEEWPCSKFWKCVSVLENGPCKVPLQQKTAFKHILECSRASLDPNRPPNLIFAGTTTLIK